LFVFYFILNPLAGNLDQVDLSLALRPLILLLLVAAVSLLLIYVLLKDWQYAAYLVFLVYAFFFLFGHLNRLAQEMLPIPNKNLEELVLLAVWGGLLVFLSIKRLWSRLGGRGWMIPFFNLVFMLSLARPGFLALSQMLGELHRPHYISGNLLGNFLPNTGDLKLDCSSRPDIYYIVLDAYGRADVIDSLYGLDNQPFIDYLKSKGFYVAGESETNYTQTVFSIPSSLNFAYIDPPQEGVSGLKYFSDLVKDNRLMSSLKRCGYQTVAIESGFFFTNQPKVDVYFSSNIELNEFESLLLADSPIEILAYEFDLQPVAQSNETHRRQVLFSFEKLAELYKIPGPKMVFAHIVSPHPPFVFDIHGQPVEPSHSYSIGDGDDYPGTLAEYRVGYARQVQFVNQKMEQIIDIILANSSAPPVIIIQGDHGPGSQLDWGSPGRSCLWERSSILNAYYLPSGGSDHLYASISPVNSFRVVLDTYFGANLALLPDRTYFTSHRLERQAIDITAERTSRLNCSQADGEK